MMDKGRIKVLVQEALSHNDSLFLIDLDFFSSNEIKVVIDGDSGVTLHECVRISRDIERNLDSTEDFAIEVTSPDITMPLKLKRQYKKNINRILSIKTETDSFEGVLTQINENNLVLRWKTREPKPIGKGKITIEKTVTVPYTAIKEATVKIIYN